MLTTAGQVPNHRGQWKSFKNAVCLRDFSVHEQAVKGKTKLSESYPGKITMRSFSSNGFKESSQRVVQLLATLLDGYQMCTSHAWAEEGGVGMLSWLGAPHYVLMTSLSGHNSYELHVFCGNGPKARSFLEATQKNTNTFLNILLVALKFCFIFAHFHFVDFVRLFILFISLFFTHDSQRSLSSHIRHTTVKFKPEEEKRKRNRSSAKHVLVKDKIHCLCPRSFINTKNTHIKTQ